MVVKLAAHESSMHRLMGVASVIAALSCGMEAPLAASFVEPTVLASEHGVLDILMIAKPQSLPTISFTPPVRPRPRPSGRVRFASTNW